VSDTKAKKIEAVVEYIANDLTYIPSPEQRRLKQAFWARFNDNPICDPQDISKSVVDELAPDYRLGRWWPQPGFKEWFSNKEEFREEVDALVFLALDRMKRILISEDPKMAGAQVSAAKLLMDVGRKMPPKVGSEKFLDEKIHQMDKKQLEEYISRSVKLIPPTQEISSKDLTPTASSDIIGEVNQEETQES
jgi:hypothetical protein